MAIVIPEPAHGIWIDLQPAWVLPRERLGRVEGVAFGTDCFGVCSPIFGLRVHRVSPGAGGASADARRLPSG